jgi:hypothetical protein
MLGNGRCVQIFRTTSGLDTELRKEQKKEGNTKQWTREGA